MTRRLCCRLRSSGCGFWRSWIRGSTNYHIPLGWRLKGGLDRSAWQRSLDRVLARHEALRSVFVAPEGKPWVEVLPEDAGLPVVEHDLRDRPDADEALLGLCREEACTPFDLARGPLIRGRLIRISDEEHVLLLTQHHIVSDGWSLGVLAHELSQLYRAFVAGEGDPLPPLANPVSGLCRLATAVAVGRAAAAPGAVLAQRPCLARQPVWRCRRTGRGRRSSRLPGRRSRSLLMRS
ncbi:condensation domain-containing protein [Bradyrhizobium sp. BR 1432]|uniref:condensation domain-containing protein n=1 Tax=Bradyrhizobium sp. BR 1432 TaxID=3447966 RepID=UPI003EE6B3BB